MVYGVCEMNTAQPQTNTMINVNVSYATVAEHKDGLGQTGDIYDDVNTRQ